MSNPDDSQPIASPPADMPPDIDPRVWQAMQDMNRFAEQDENGVDLSLIAHNLSKSPLERIRSGDRMCRDHHWIRNNVRRIR